MEITIEINDNVADDEREIKRMMAQARQAIALGFLAEGESAPLFDFDGNRAGWVTLR